MSECQVSILWRIFFKANIPHFSQRNSKTKYFLPSFSIHSRRYSCECVCRIIKLTITDSDKNVYNNSLHSHIWHISHFVGDTYIHNCCRARCLKISIQLCRVYVYPQANEFYINWRKIVGNWSRMEHTRMEELDRILSSLGPWSHILNGQTSQRETQIS